MPAGLAIVGPTASGKTEVSIEAARRLGGEIISVDSRQVYRGMDIGTAKATSEQRAAVPHHGLDLVDPDERYSAGRFARYARKTIRGIRGRGRVPVLVGGTGFFLRALTRPLFSEPELPGEERRALHEYLGTLGSDELRRWLAALDPATAKKLRRSGGRQRAERALEVALLSGRPLSWWHEHAPPEKPPVSLKVIVLELPREELYATIDRRVDRMLEAGLLEEVRGLLNRGFRPSDPGMSATGYAELIPVIRGERELEDAADEIRRTTRRYARRQITWFRHQVPADSVRLAGARTPEELAAEIEEIWKYQTE